MEEDSLSSANSISVVTPTLRRPIEVVELLDNLSRQTRRPDEVILVDGAPPAEMETENAVRGLSQSLPFRFRYIRHDGGTAIQRNTGIDAATGQFIAFVDDDVRLDPDFFEQVLAVFANDGKTRVGGIVGYRANEYFTPESAQRWRWYRRLRLLCTYEPGRYDFRCGYPINANMQAPFSGVRMVDFMTTSCATWRREVFDRGLRFDRFFRDYGMLEDAHLSLRAGREWELLQCGDARCTELHSPNGRVDRRRAGYKSVVNYYYVFSDIVGPLTWRHKIRFWRFQLFEMLRVGSSAIRRRRFSDVSELRGRLEGIIAAARGFDAAV
jgi:glycosyltransferase involved in cell wall biosynthesis